MWGISQPGFYASAGMIDAHPALVAVSPQAPVTDYYLGDDVYHNGAFMLAANFGFYQSFRPRTGDPEPPQPTLPFRFGSPDGYEFFLNMGSLGNSEEKYFKRSESVLDGERGEQGYDDFWQSAVDLEVSEGHQAGGDGGGRLVRRRGSAGAAADARVYGAELAARRPTCW